MDRKQEVMVALAAAVGSNCIPCFDHLYAKAREVDLSADQIQKTVETAFKVKNGAGLFMKNAVGEVTGEATETQAPCCEPSTCDCG